MYHTEMVVTWSHLDANRHMRNTAYSEFATHARINFFRQSGQEIDQLAHIGIGPILLKEELIYLREVKMHEKLSIAIELSAVTENYSHYTIEHIFRKENGKKSARVVIHGAWIDLSTRKRCLPTTEMIDQVIQKMPQKKEFSIRSYRKYVFV